MKHIRKLYEQLGADEYYKRYSDQYQNPHLPQVRKLLLQNHEKLDCSSILDFCAGGGEVSLMLKELGYKTVRASDPYTHKLYQKKVGKPCEKWSFEDVIRGKMSGTYTTIICSFAMHLCPQEQLYPLCIQLFQHSPTIVILSPHKRPQLELLTGVNLSHEDYTLTPKGKKVFLKIYQYEF